jgi:phosphatidylethanolamine-binding protein (PEBP) family uncharacterized protein
MSKVKVSKIKIDLGNDRALELTAEQAKELQKVLDDLFGERTKTVVVEKHYERPYWYPYTHWTVSNISYPTIGVPQENGTISSGATWSGNTTNIATVSLRDDN